MNDETFEKELAMCRKFRDEKGGCSWGRCEDCGVIPFLYKVFKNQLIENPEEVKKVKGF